MRFVFLD